MSENRSDQASATGTVELTVPADPAYVSVLRAVTASLAARHDLTLDEVDDLRIAVDEACAILLPQAVPGASLYCSFWVRDSSLTVEVSTTCESPRIPSEHGFAWRVLSALAHEATAHVSGQRLVLTLTRTAGRS